MPLSRVLDARRTSPARATILSLGLVSMFALSACDKGGKAKAGAEGGDKAATGPVENADEGDDAADDDDDEDEAGADDGADGGGKVQRPEMKKHLVDFEPKELERLKLMGSEVAADIEAGQKAVEAGDWAAAVTAYQKAIEIDEDNPHIHGALGWAQFHTKDYEAAAQNLYAALRHEPDADRRADYLYRLGRVEEETGDFVSAKRHYDHSLRLKDNPNAKERDDSMAAKVAELCKGDVCTKPDYETLDLACAAMLERVHKQLRLKPHEADDAFACSPDKAQRIKLEGGSVSEAVLLKLSGEHGIVEEEQYDLLAHIDGGWHWVGTMLDIENPHKDGIFRTGKVLGFEARELVPDLPGQEILLHVELEESDSDLADNIVFHDEHEAYIVCGMLDGQHNCHEIPVRELYEAEALDVNRPAKGKVEKKAFKAKATFDGKGNVTVEGEGDIPSEYRGTHAIMSLHEPHGFVFLHED